MLTLHHPNCGKKLTEVSKDISREVAAAAVQFKLEPSRIYLTSVVFFIDRKVGSKSIRGSLQKQL
jgi:hypothetical protein